MDYINFKYLLKESVEMRLDDSFSVNIQQVTKNNSTFLDGLYISKSGCNISPTIYINNFYIDYQEGKAVEKIAEEILNIYHENALENDFNVNDFLDFDYVKDRIALKLVNYEKNRELLKSVPHERYLDLAIVFYYLIEESSMNNATILIHDSHCQHWGVNAEELFKLASLNTPRLLRSRIKNMNDYIMSLGNELGLEMGLESFDLDRLEDDITPMYILSNESNMFGAVSILYDGVLEEIAEILQHDLIILPSSIHEVILVPDTGETAVEYFRQMVSEVNETTVSDEEILSDSVYCYYRKEKRIKKIA